MTAATISRPARGTATPIDDPPDGTLPGQGRAAKEVTISNAQPLLDPALCFAADVLSDLERTRTAQQNRHRQLTRSEEDSDGEVRGFGLDEWHPDVALLAAMVDTLRSLEHDATLQLQRQLRRHPLHPWVQAQKGVGEKQAARLLAVIGDPYINSVTGLPRTVSALWAFCGLHVSAAGVAPKHARGQRSNWSPTAKMRAYLIAESCMKQIIRPCSAGTHVVECACSPYRLVYERRRRRTATTRPGWTDGHAHNDALRIASKAILRDLWRAARDLRGESA